MLAFNDNTSELTKDRAGSFGFYEICTRAGNFFNAWIKTFCPGACY